jgi:Cu-processing system permease protein
MRTIVKHIFLDVLRNKTMIVYTMLLFVIAFSVLNIDSNPSKGLLSLMNISLLFVPVISVLFATIYFFNSIEFIELLLSQPIKRKTVLFACYAALSSSLCIAYLLGIGIPLLIFSAGMASLTLLVSGVLLTLIFSAFALLIFVLFKDKTKGIGAAIILSLFFSLLFDGLFIAFIYSFSDYPIDKAAIGILSLNPVDLARVLMMLQLDIAVMMGYSGALFKKFLGSATGSIYTIICMFCWIVVPLLFSFRVFKRKDL